MSTFPRGLVNYRQLDAEIQDAIRKLGPEVEDVSYSFREDSTGDPSIFFRIVLTDEVAAQHGRLVDITEGIVRIFLEEVSPIENWGLHPYFNYSSHSEHQRRNELANTR